MTEPAEPQPITHTSHIRSLRTGVYASHLTARSIFVGNSTFTGMFAGAVLLGSARVTVPCECRCAEEIRDLLQRIEGRLR